ncbi:MAG: polymerase sigma54 factor [Bacteriovoracaceae bacterium]|nr:polymerase sigma54 factor [Bacteriovoracaceae bacterium]
MAVDLKLSMRLGQTMVMTPQLQAAIKLLQMNRLELSETIQTELNENPLLEEGSEVSELEQKKAEQEQADSSDTMHEVSPDTDRNPDFDWDTYIEQSFSYSGKSSSGLGFDPSQEEGPGFESLSTKKKNLTDHLMDQVQMSDLDNEERDFAVVLIASLDEWGYLREPLEEICKKHKVKYELGELVLKLMQEFDPIGVGARDLRECLMLQLNRAKNIRKVERDLLRELIENQLPNLEKKNFKAIAKDLGLEMDELGDTIRLLQKFEPRPARPFIEMDNPYITPDIYIHKINGEYVITLNEDGLPKLKISNLYRSILQQMPEIKEIVQVARVKTVEEELAILAGAEKALSAQAVPPPKVSGKQNPKEYIQNKLRSALWLIRSIHQRQRTIYKVTESIVKSQREFLEQGVTHLRPMVLKDIATDIGMHESTISRVTSNKYVHTPQGTFELKYFFSSGIQKSNGDGIASESVKEKIRMIVKSEDQFNPVSDQGIVQALQRQGIEIARRTVAKYREMLGILPSSQRKNLF